VAVSIAQQSETHGPRPNRDFFDAQENGARELSKYDRTLIEDEQRKSVDVVARPVDGIDEHARGIGLLSRRGLGTVSS
jgi:hypothetical protein